MSEPLKIYANYGAMHPRQSLVVKSCDGEFLVAQHDDGFEQKIRLSDIRKAKPASGSPIGLYWNERDAY
jgi:hypothetical protein